MLRSLLIGLDERLSEELATGLGSLQDVEVVGVLTRYPMPEDLLRDIRVYKPEVLFLSIEDLSQVEPLVAELDRLASGVPIVAVGAELRPEDMRRLIHLGFREYLTAPFIPAQLAEVVESTVKFLAQHPLPSLTTGDIYAFLPAKPGVGTSTIAVGASCALANNLGIRTLLLDGDLDAGSIQFLLKLENTASLQDALQNAEKLDEDLFSQMVGKVDKLAALHAGRLDQHRNVDPAGLERFLSIARSQYQVICSDLPSSLDSMSITLMRESRLIFVVTTPEVLPLHFARERVRHLKKLGLGDQIRLLVNRRSSGLTTIADGELAEMVGQPIAYTLPDNRQAVQQAILTGRPISNGSNLGDCFLALAHSMVPHEVTKVAPSSHKFLDFFRVQGQDRSTISS